VIAYERRLRTLREVIATGGWTVASSFGPYWPGPPEGGGGVGTLRKICWGPAACFPKPLPYSRAKSLILPIGWPDKGR